MDKPFAILEQWVREGRIHLSHEPLRASGEAVDDDALVDRFCAPLECGPGTVRIRHEGGEIPRLERCPAAQSAAC